MSRQPIKKQTVRTLTDYQQESRAGILFNLQRDTLEGRRPTETGEPAESSKTLPESFENLPESFDNFTTNPWRSTHFS